MIPRSAALLAPVLLLTIGCPKKKDAASEEGIERNVTEKALPEDGMLLQEVDLNGDGQADIFNYLRERTGASRLLLEKRVDLNLDGTVDVISYFDESGALEREEMDSDFDGRLDWTDHYQGGKRVASQMDTDFDGRPNIYFYYTSGPNGVPLIERKERDTNGDGNIDYWERFDDKGNVVKTARDTDGDGKMDVRDE